MAARWRAGVATVGLLAASVWVAPPADAAAAITTKPHTYTLVITEPGQDLPLDPSPLAGATGGTGPLRIAGYTGAPGVLFGFGGGAYTFEAPWSPVGGKFLVSYLVEDVAGATAAGTFTLVLVVQPPRVPPAGSFGDGPQVLSVARDGRSATVAFSVVNPPDLLHRAAAYTVTVDGAVVQRSAAVSDGERTATVIATVAGGSHAFCVVGTDASPRACRQVDVPVGNGPAAAATPAATSAVAPAPTAPRPTARSESSAPAGSPASGVVPKRSTSGGSTTTTTAADGRPQAAQALAALHTSSTVWPVSATGQQGAWSGVPVAVVLAGALALLWAAASGFRRRHRS